MRTIIGDASVGSIGGSLLSDAASGLPLDQDRIDAANSLGTNAVDVRQAFATYVRPKDSVVVVLLSSSPGENPPLQVAVRSVGAPAVAVTDQLRAVSKERFARMLGAVSLDEMVAVEDGIRAILDL